MCSLNHQSTLCHHLVNTSQDLPQLPAAYYTGRAIPSSQVTLKKYQQMHSDLQSQLTSTLDVPFPVCKTSLSSTHKCTSDFHVC